METRLGKSVYSGIEYEILPQYLRERHWGRHQIQLETSIHATHTHTCTHTHANRNTHVYITHPDTNKEKSFLHSLTTRCCLCPSPRTIEQTPKQLVNIVGLFYLLLLPCSNYSLLPFPPCVSVPMESLPHTVPVYATEERVFVLPAYRSEVPSRQRRALCWSHTAGEWQCQIQVINSGGPLST